MKESEAKTKWCPFARGTVERFKTPDNETVPVTANRDYNGIPLNECLCLGSGCMCWEHYSIQKIDGKEVNSGGCGLIGERE